MTTDHGCLWDGVHDGVHGVHSWAVLAMVGADPSAIHVNLNRFRSLCESRKTLSKFMVTVTTLERRHLPLLVLGIILPWLDRLGPDFRKMMWNESGG